MFSGVRLAWRILRRALPGVALAFCVCGSVQGAPAPSLDMMAGQMLLVGFKGQEPEDCAAVLEDIHLRHLGGVILFTRDAREPATPRNIRDAAQLGRLTSALRAAADIPLLIGVDQEGGKVARLGPANGFPAFPSAEGLGRGTPEATRESARRLGRMLHAAGINLDFAPVLDVNVYPDSPAIGRLGRAFSADPERVAAHGAAFAQGLNAAGVAAAFKHFPGHGSARADSHQGVTDISETWGEAELAPYEAALREAGAHMVMVGHVFHRGLDPVFPATLSPAVIEGLLRRRLGYDGVVITDDLQMRAIADHYSFEEVVLRAVEAGADILLFGNNLDYDPGIVSRAQAVLVGAVREGRLPRARLETSWRRIMGLKAEMARAEEAEEKAEAAHP